MNVVKRVGQAAVVIGSVCAAILSTSAAAHAQSVERYRVVTIDEGSVSEGVATITGRYSCAGGTSATTSIEVTVEQYVPDDTFAVVGTATATRSCPAKEQKWSVDASAVPSGGVLRPFVNDTQLRPRVRMRYHGSATSLADLVVRQRVLMVDPIATFSNGAFTITETYECPTSDGFLFRSGEISQVNSGRVALNAYRARYPCTDKLEKHTFTVSTGTLIPFVAGAVNIGGQLRTAGVSAVATRALYEAVVFSS